MRSAVWKDVLCRSSDSNSKPYELFVWAAVFSFWKKEKTALAFSVLFKFARPCHITRLPALGGEHVRPQKPTRRTFLVEGLGLLLVSRSAL